WALVLGFTLSGAVQAFVSRAEMQARLGNHGPAAIGRATLYGVLSSSCSYAASAMARSMVARGADFLAAMVFMLASTNLVVELGIVLVVLIGWQFLAAEVVGGVIMIILLVVAGGLWLRGRVLDEARRTAAGVDADHRHGGHEGHGDHDDHGGHGGHGGDGAPWHRRLRSVAGWSDAAGYALSDLTMLRKEMTIGFVVAGFLAVLVPDQVWNAVLIHGHGVWTTLENVVVGPFVAVISFVCSVGNVPLAAALWKGGIRFGGVVSFVFADLITMPLLLIYRKQYGPRMALRMLAVLWGVMSLAGLATQGIFELAGWVPATRPVVVAADAFHWDATTALDIVAMLTLAVLWWLRRNRDRLGGGAGYATDPVCGMQVEVATAPASAEHAGHVVRFCSERCRDRFARDPAPFVRRSGPRRTGEDPRQPR
ncbi:MAG: permease, partial [Acidimicrobiales bacterium]